LRFLNFACVFRLSFHAFFTFLKFRMSFPPFFSCAFYIFEISHESARIFIMRFHHFRNSA